MSGDLINFAKAASILIDHGLRRQTSLSKEGKEAFSFIVSDDEASEAFRVLAEGMGLVPIISPLGSSIAVVPTDTSSPFATKVSDIRRRLRDGEKPEIFGFFALATVAAFYPTRESISFSSVNSVTEKDVLDMVKALVEFAKVEAGEGGEGDRAAILANRIEAMPDSGKSDGGSFRDFYVKAALKHMVESRLVQERTSDAETTYHATSLLRDIALNRLNESTLQMAELLNRYHDKQSENEFI